MRAVTLPVLVAVLLASAPAMAQDAPATVAPAAIKAGQMIRTSDGLSVGRVEEVQMNGAQPVSVSVIFNQHFIHIPATTLAASPKGLVTSLTRKDVVQLR